MKPTIYPRTVLKSAKLIGKEIHIKFPLDQQTLDQVRSITGRRWHSIEKYWSCPASVNTCKQLIQWGFHFDELLQEYLSNAQKKLTESSVKTNFEIAGLNGILRPFQKTGVGLIDNFNGNAILADDMGLGKTIQTLAYLQLHIELRPAIIVVPACVKLNWQREALKWLNKPKIQILNGQTPDYTQKADLFIINYDILPYWLETLYKIQAKILILDEVQYVKSNKANRTKAVKKLAKRIDHVLSLSGTPIMNRPIEIFNAWSMSDPVNCPSYWDFTHRYCNPKHNGYGWDFNGASNIPELHQKLLDSCMIRRLKKDVLTELPEMQSSFLPFEIDNEKEYRDAERNFIQYVRVTKGDHAATKAEGAETLSQIEGLKQLAVKGKLNQTVSWIEDFLESGEKLVVFAHHKFVIEQLATKFGNICRKIDGSASMQQRQESVDLFQQDPLCQLMIISLAGGVGITLTGASNLAVLEYPWDPMTLDQILSRIHRLGQVKNVMIYFTMGLNTIDEKIAKLLDEKRKIVDAVMDGKETEVTSLLTELLKEYKNETND